MGRIKKSPLGEAQISGSYQDTRGTLAILLFVHGNICLIPLSFLIRAHPRKSAVNGFCLSDHGDHGDDGDDGDLFLICALSAKSAANVFLIRVHSR